MSEQARLLCTTGAIKLQSPEWLESLTRIDGEIDPLSLAELNLAIDKLAVDFNGVADGRGFSQAKAVRDIGYQGSLYAAGYINPDQLSLAFQTGFDGVLVSAVRWADYGEDVWTEALAPIVNHSYAITSSSAHRSIWQLRHSE